MNEKKKKKLNYEELALFCEQFAMTLDAGLNHMDGISVMLEDAMHGIVLEHVREVVRVEEVVDADDLDVIREVLDRGAEHHAADTAEAVDANFDSHFFFTPCDPVEVPTPPEI